VLVIDGDLRKGSLARQYGIAEGKGLASLLAGQVQNPPIVKVAGFDNLDVIVRGRIAPPNPSELLSTKGFRDWLSVWRNEYDLIIVDGAPVLPVTDPLLIQPYADLTILLCRSKVTERQQLQRSYSLLARNSDKYVGVMLNGVDPKDPAYYGYYGYYGYREQAYGAQGDQYED
jgi:capsular exopolysaccharide synthesis family protein